MVVIASTSPTLRIDEAELYDSAGLQFNIAK